MTTGLTVTLSIAKRFSRYPAGRVPADGPYNGTRFREEFLVPELRRLGPSDRLQVDFDGLEGAGSSFLEEAFGGLVRVERMDRPFLDTRLDLTTTQDGLRDFVRMARKHIENAIERAG